ncbi:MAG: arylsulfatase [Candidatus Hydrogenedentes bacterium]|nr:arylsulfatase [Candidatus Hydrogenedentota bacterium]
MSRMAIGRRVFLGSVGLGAASMALAGCRTASGGSAGGRSQKPNIVFLMADDMGYGDVGCYGATKIPTPNMDALAEQGVRFTDAHAPSAVCTPTRYGVLTGRYCWRSRLKHGVLDGFSPPLIEPERLTVASMLRAQGYATAGVGKWHLGLGWAREGDEVDYAQPIAGGPVELGFDYYFGISASLDFPPYCFIENDRTVGIPNVEKDPYNPQQRKGLMVPGWEDDQVGPTVAAKACAFMEGHVRENPDQPFFLYMPTSAPHRPCVPPDFIKGRSQAGPRGDMVVEVDWALGEVVKTLERLQVADNTLVIVTSDNGARPTCFNGKDYGHKSCGDWRGYKADIWDGGHRVPFIARWPQRIAPGTTSTETICLTDLMATCAAITGTSLPDDAGPDSYNILPALLGEAGGEPIREAVVHHSFDGMFSIRQGRWKLVQGRGSGGFSKPRRVEPKAGEALGQLYDMEADPAEAKNVWLEYPEVVERLTAILDRYIEDGRSRPL